MLRGTTIFTCDNCGHTFKGLDIEYNCTVLSAPQQCPKCGSFHTMPDDSCFGRNVYLSIWKDCDKHNSSDVTCYYPQDRLEDGIKECNEWNSVENHDKEDGIDSL